MDSSYRILKPEEVSYLMKGINPKYKLEILRALKNVKVTNKITKTDIKDIKSKIRNLIDKEDVPRLLTVEEIDEIVSIIPKTPVCIDEIAINNRDQIRKKISERLSKFNFSVKNGTIDRIKNIIYEQFIRSTNNAGDSVGVMSAMAIGQPLTQYNLNTFHSTGQMSENEESIKTVQELFDLPSNRSIYNCIVHFKNKNLVPEEVKLLGDLLKGMTVSDFVITTEIYNDIPEEDKIWYENYEKCFNKEFKYNNNKFLRIFLNISNCYIYDIFPEDIIRIIEKNTRSVEISNTVNCIGFPSYMGIIDVHGNEEYIRMTVEKFSQIGQKLPGCSYTRKTDTSSSPTYLKTPFVNTDLKDMTTLFLKVVLSDCFKDMMIKGVKGIKNFRAAIPKKILNTFTESPVYSDRDLRKFSEDPFNMKLEEIMKLWYIKIDRKSIIFDGIPKEKYISLFREAKMKIILEDLDSDDPYLVIKMPSKRTELFLTKDNKSISRYTLTKEGLYYDNKDKNISSNKSYNPKKLITNIIEYEEDKIRFQITEKLSKSKEDFNIELPEFPQIYRDSFYAYAIVEGKNIIKELISNSLVDKKFTYPNYPYDIYKLYGIEAARFYLINRYNSLKLLENVNPSNTSLLADFQTSMGFLSAVTFIGVAKQGNSALSSASFQNSMEAFQKASAFGNTDEIKGISSCIMTGKKCRNGTGLVNVSFDADYLDSPNNKVKSIEEPEEIVITTDNIIGSCFSNVSKLRIDSNIDNEKENNDFTEATELINEGKKPRICPKPMIPKPPRMKEPKIIMEIGIYVESIVNSRMEEDIDITEIEDIPDLPPGLLEEDFF